MLVEKVEQLREQVELDFGGVILTNGGAEEA